MSYRSAPKFTVESVGAVYGKTWRCSGHGISVLGTTPSAAQKGWAVEFDRQRKMKQAKG